MKNIVLAGATLALAMAAGSAAAAGGTAQGNFGLNVPLSKETISGQPIDFMLNGKYFIAKDMAVIAGFGLNIIDTGAATNASYTAIGFKAGMRKYMKTDEFAPFIGGNFQYISTRDTTIGSDISGFAIVAEAGAEYFFAKQFSVEGSVNIGYLSAESEPVAGGPTTDTSGFGTAAVNLSANFYF